MKKYVLKSSGEELKEGDLIVLDFVKEAEDGTKLTEQVKCTFSEEHIPTFLAMGVIKEKEELIGFSEGKKEDSFSYDEVFEMLNCMCDRQKAAQEVIEKLVEEVTILKRKVAKLTPAPTKIKVYDLI